MVDLGRLLELLADHIQLSKNISTINELIETLSDKVKDNTTRIVGLENREKNLQDQIENTFHRMFDEKLRTFRSGGPTESLPLK